MSDNPSTDHANEHPDPVAPPTETETSPEPIPGQGRFGLLIVAGMVLLADLTLFRSEGFTGPATFLIGAIALLVAGIRQRSFNRSVFVLVIMILLLGLRLAMNGYWMQVTAGLWLISGLSLALRDRTPFVAETFVHAAQCVPGGYEFYSSINRRVHENVLDPMDSAQPGRFVEFLLPLVAAVAFGGIFVMANPDMVTWVSTSLADVFASINEFLMRFSTAEFIFWLVVAWLTGGLIRPYVAPLMSETTSRPAPDGEAPLYKAFRNTLLTVIAVFVAYLAFESRAFFSQEPPEGFTYSSYAHEGAAWLTVALALATITLSLIFRGRTLSDPRLPGLRKLAWVWSGLNLLLAIAVYNRMWIYVGFNGMTRMRTIGLLGITSVVCGFALVLVKINRSHDFLWLIRRQLWVVATAVYIYLVLPVDSLIHRYNVRRILGGNEAPIVQITEHPIDYEALPDLLPLCEAEDNRLRRGVQALLTHKFVGVAREVSLSKTHWTRWQSSNNATRDTLEAQREKWDIFQSRDEREEAWKTLKQHAFETWW